MKGKRVFFQSGSDEHGQKIANTAAALGLRPIDICDKYAGKSSYFFSLRASLAKALVVGAILFLQFQFQY